MNRTQKSKCRRIAEKYGVAAQEQQSVSELAELNLALTRRPDQRKPDWKENLAEEIADVTIMIEQLMILHDIGRDTVSDIIDKKLKRQLNRIESEADDA